MKGVKGIAEGKYVCITNDVGGTTVLPERSYRVEITRGFYDYETGQRLIGVLLDSEDVARARVTGTTGFADGSHNFHPEVVYFGGYDFKPEQAVA